MKKVWGLVSGQCISEALRESVRNLTLVPAAHIGVRMLSAPPPSPPPNPNIPCV